MTTEEKLRKRTRSYVEETYKKITEQPEIKDVIILNEAGNPVKSTMDDTITLQHAGHFELLLQKSRYVVQQLDERDDVLSLRVRTKYHEVIVIPDAKITILVIQDPIDRIQLEKAGQFIVPC